MNGIRQPGPAWDVTSGDGSALLRCCCSYYDTLTTRQLSLPLQTPLKRTPRFLEELEVLPLLGLGAQRLREDVEEPVKTHGWFSPRKVISQESPTEGCGVCVRVHSM